MEGKVLIGIFRKIYMKLAQKQKVEKSIIVVKIASMKWCFLIVLQKEMMYLEFR